MEVQGSSTWHVELQMLARLACAAEPPDTSRNSSGLDIVALKLF